jgi:transposase InsO family protein
MIAATHAQGACTIRSGCQALDVCESGYYAWQRRQAHGPSAREAADAQLTRQIAVLHQESGQAYGSPRIHAALRQAGASCSKHRVARLMRQAGLRSRRARTLRRIRTTDSCHGLPVAGNLLARDFAAAACDEKWGADVTYIPTETGWLFLAVILDLCSRKVVGWAAATRFNRELVCRALHNALEVRPAPHLLHSDRGVQYASDDYQALLAQAGIQCSMSRRGDCYDNAVVESFFASLKSEIDMPRDGFANPDQARRALFAYIEGFYNPRRLHSALDYMSPVAFEAHTATALGSRFA